MEPNRTPQEIEEKGKWFKDLLHGAAGAYDQTLLGLPSWIASKVAPEATARFKSQPGFRMGKNIASGTGSIFGGAVPFVASMVNNPDARNFMAGVGNANLMGAPEWAAKKLEGKTLFGKELLPEGAVAGFKKAAGPAYTVGKVAGTIGSALVPVTGAKGMVSGLGQLGAGGMKALQGMKGLEAGWNATKLARAAPALGKALLAGGKGAAESALQAGMRTGFAGGDAGKIAKEAGIGALTGGLMSGGFSALGQALGKGKAVASAVDTIADTTRGAALKGISPGLNLRGINKYMNFVSGKGASMIKKASAVDEGLQAVLDFARKNDINSPLDVKNAAKELLSEFGKADAAFDAIHGATSGAGLIDDMVGRKGFMEALDAIQGTSKDKVIKALGDIRDSVGNAQGLAPVRQFIRDEIDAAFDLASNADKRAIMGAGHAILGQIDDMVGEAVEATGTALKKPFQALLKDYKHLMPLAEGVYRTALPRAFSVGSPTQIQTAAKEASEMAMGKGAGLLGRLGGGAGIGGLSAAATPGDWKKKLAAGAIGAGAGMLGAPMLGRAMTKIVGKGSAIASGLQETLPEIGEAVERMAPAAGKLATAAGQGLRAAEQARGEDAPAFGPRPAPEGYAAPPGGEKSAEQEGAEAGEALAAGDEDTYISKITDRIDSFWKTSGAETMFPGQQAAFAQAVYQATDGFSPTKTAAILYQDPIERESYLNALKVNSSISSTFDQAADQPKFWEGVSEKFGGRKDIALGREAAEQSVLGAVSEVAPKGVTPKVVQETVAKILNGQDSPLEKRKRLEVVLKNYGVDFDLLRQAGVI